MFSRSDVIELVEEAIERSPRILRVEVRLSSVEDKLSAVEAKQDAMQASQDAMQASQDGMQASLDAMQASQDGMQASLDAMQASQDAMQDELHRHGLLFEEMLRNQNLILDAVIPARQRALQIDEIEQTLEAHDVRLLALETKLARPTE